MRLIWVGRETENFLMWDWTTQITLIRFNKIAFCGNRGPSSIFELPALRKRSTNAGTVNWIKCTVTVIPTFGQIYNGLNSLICPSCSSTNSGAGNPSSTAPGSAELGMDLATPAPGANTNTNTTQPAAPSK
jgi:hypothetical protein